MGRILPALVRKPILWMDAAYLRFALEKAFIYDRVFLK